jgi:protein TonB
MPFDCRLTFALLLSATLHAALLGVTWSGPATPPEPARARPLEARLVAAPLLPPAPTPAEAPTPRAATSPVGTLSQKAKPAPVRRPRPNARTAPTPTPTAKIDSLARQLARQLFYPPQAVAQGLEGTALVTVFFDPDGSVIAVRLERSSGHAILDDAALAAVRSLRTLPQTVATETLVPVRFRLD